MKNMVAATCLLLAPFGWVKAEDAKALDFGTAYRTALQEGKLFVCFVGMPGRPIPGCACCTAKTYEEVVQGDGGPAGACIVIAARRDSQLRRVATLNKDATDAEIQAYGGVAQPMPVALFQPAFLGGFGGGGFGGGCSS